MVLVMGGEKAHEAYLTSIRATKYDFDKAEWVVEDGVVNAAAKCKTPDVKKEEDKTTAAIGDKVTFTVDSDVPTYPASAYDVAYELEDTMAEGLTFNGDLKAYGINATGRTELTPGTEFKADYTQSTTDGKTKIFKLKFDYSLIKDYTQIELVYSATVNEKIKIGSDQNTNKVKFTYDHKEKSSYTVLYSFGFDLTKRADSETGELLAGAEFELRQNGNALTFKKLSDGHYAVDPAGETKLVTGEQGKMKGKIIIDGLNVGDYKLKETKAPDNFNLMQGEKDVTITQNGEALEKHLLANTNNKEISKSAYWYQTVVDKRISGLPATGGMGTTIFMVAGIAVMACAGRRVDGRAQAPEAQRGLIVHQTKRAARKRVSGGVRSKHEKALPVLAVVLIFVLGLGIMLYPAVANYLNAQSQTVAIDQYEEAARANTAYYEGLLEQAQAFNEGVLKRGTLAVMTRGGKGGIQFAA